MTIVMQGHAVDNEGTTLLVLDLDETLIHSSPVSIGRRADHRVFTYHVYERPGLRDFLEFVFRRFSVGVWTGSTAHYAEAILSRLVDLSRFQFVWTREHCSIAVQPGTGRFDLLKDIRQLETFGYSRERIVVVDDVPERLWTDARNVLPIAPYRGCPGDRELVGLTEWMHHLASVGDVRAVDKWRWREHPPPDAGP